MSKIKMLLMCMLVSNSCFASLVLPEKIYIDDKELDMSHGRILIHLDHNNWIEAKSIQHDEQGIYALESNVVRNMKSSSCEYERSWKCPYCNQYWPVGKKCRNDDCPRHYSDCAKVK